MIGDPFAINLLPVVVLSFLALVARLAWRSWWAPAPLFAAYCLGAFAVPMLVVWWFPVWATGLWAIVAIVVAYLSGAAIATSMHRGGAMFGPVSGALVAGRREAELARRTSYLAKQVLVLCAAAIIGVGPLLGLLEQYSALQIVELSRSAAIARYDDDLAIPLVTKLSWVALFASACLGGLLSALSRQRHHRAICLIPFLIAAAYMLILTTKLTLVMVGALFAATYVPARIAAQRADTALLRKGISLRLLAGVLIIALAMVGSQMLRYGFVDESLRPDQLAVLTDRVAAYFAGHVSAFTGWVAADGLWSSDFALGRHTFAGLFEAFGVWERTQGLYDFGGLHVGVVQTNVFSAFRGLVEDFSFPGTLLILFVCGATSQFFHQRHRDFRVAPMLWMVVWNSFMALCFLASMFTWNVAVGGIALFSAMYVRYASRFRGGRSAGMPLGGSYPISLRKDQLP